MGIALLDTTRNALDSDALPLVPPDPAAFTTYTGFDAGIAGHLGSVLGGPLTSLTPEPGTLVAVGLGALIFVARRKRDQGG